MENLRYPFDPSCAWPITQKYGENPGAYARWGLKAHNGIDFGAPSGTPVLASAGGFVERADFDADGYGWYVEIIHNGLTTVYAHLSEIRVQAHAEITAGRMVGKVGSTGNSTGPHLHFEVRQAGQGANGYGGAIDPEPLIEWPGRAQPGAGTVYVVKVDMLNVRNCAGSGGYVGLATADATAGRLYYSVPNQMTAGTGGAEVAPATGDTATGFVTSSGGTWSKVARSDGKPGTWQQCVIGAEADTATFGMYDITAGFAVGDTIFAQVEFESDNDWTTPEAIQLYLGALDAGDAVKGYVTSLGHSTGGGSGTGCVRIGAGILRTPNFVLPVGTTKIRPYITVLAASGTWRVCRFEIRKV